MSPWLIILLTAIPTIPGILAAILARGAREQSVKNNDELKENTKETVQTKMIINGRMDEMIRLAKAEAYAQGVLDGRKQVEIELHGRDGKSNA